MPTYTEYLSLAIEDGLRAAIEKYADIEHHHVLTGSIKGFELCRNRMPNKIVAALAYAKQDTKNTKSFNSGMIEAIEWVLAVVGAGLGHSLGVPITEMALKKAIELQEGPS